MTFDTHTIVDWSARNDRSPVKRSENSIWWAVVHTIDDVEPVTEYARTRHDAVQRLAQKIVQELGKNNRVLVGFDFPFGYPVGVAGKITC